METVSEGGNGLIMSTRDLAMLTPQELVHAIMDTGDVPATVILCAHGIHIGESLDAVKALCGGRVPDPISILGGVSTLNLFIKENGQQSLKIYEHQLRFSIKDHGSKILFILIHPLCGGARKEVLIRMPEADPLYTGKISPLDDPDLFLRQQVVETEIQRGHLVTTHDWLRSAFPKLEVEVFRITSGRLDKFDDYIQALISIESHRQVP